MARYCGSIGFATTTESSSEPGVWTETFVERTYYGDVIKNYSRYQALSKVNDDVTISNQISIVADPYANENFHAIRYATFMGSKWGIENVEVQYPRLLLTLGGVYNA